MRESYRFIQLIALACSLAIVAWSPSALAEEGAVIEKEGSYQPGTMPISSSGSSQIRADPYLRPGCVTHSPAVPFGLEHGYLWFWIAGSFRETPSDLRAELRAGNDTYLATVIVTARSPGNSGYGFEIARETLYQSHGSEGSQTSGRAREGSFLSMIWAPMFGPMSYIVHVCTVAPGVKLTFDRVRFKSFAYNESNDG